jgi:hypothetical protein
MATNASTATMPRLENEDHFIWYDPCSEQVSTARGGKRKSIQRSPHCRYRCVEPCKEFSLGNFWQMCNRKRVALAGMALSARKKPTTSRPSNGRGDITRGRDAVLA